MRTPPLALLIGFAGCSAPQLDVMPRFQQFNIDGNLAASSSGSTASNDLKSLGIDDAPVNFSPRVDFSAGGMRLSADYFDVSYAGSGQVEEEINFGGQIFPVTTMVNTEFDLKLARLAATWDFLPTKNFELGVGAGVGFADVRAFVEDQSTASSSETAEKAPFPFLAGRAGVALSDFSASLLVGYFSYDQSGVKAGYFDLDALVRWHVLGGSNHLGLSLVGGYRMTQLELEYEDSGSDIDIDAKLAGPYLGVSLTF